MPRRELLTSLAGAALFGRPGASRAAAPSQKLIETLQRRLQDRLILPGDARFDAVRAGAVHNPDTDRRPAAIALCAAADDVSRALEFAEAARLEVAVRAGGHDVLGASASDRGLLIDLAPMSRVAIDAAAGTAEVGSGVRSGQLNLVAAPHGLAPVLGCNSVVGVSGLTLGGGFGWLVGSHGAACDHLVSAEIVTADGRLRRIGPEAEPELFWAVRGGGGNFGIVTSLRLRLQPVSQVVAGAVAFRCEPTGFLKFYRDFMAAAPDPLTVELTISPGGGGPAMVVAACCWSGDLAAGEQALRPLRAYAKPLFERIGPVPLAQFASIAGGAPSGLYWRGGSFDGLSDRLIGELGGVIAEAPANASLGLGHYQHGAVLRPAADTALPRRAGQFSYFLGVGWAGGRPDVAGMAWVRRAMDALRPVSSRDGYVNYLSEDDERAVKGAYGRDRYAKLARLKRRYDPANVFHRNRNIRPA